MSIVSVTEDECDAVGPPLLEAEQRAHHTHRAADEAALVDRVAPMHKVPGVS